MIPVVEHGQIGGVPVLRADAASGRYMAALVFRVGRFDEPLPLAGITHMVEHLTFAGKPRADYHFNASVSGCYTSFHMETADLGDSRDFVDTVCRGLAAHHATVIDRERLVLRTEAASRGGAGALGVCLGERYGATGPGISNYPEFGLRNVSWRDVAAWRRSWFTADNAVLCIGGAVPSGLRVDLPPGTPPAAPAAPATPAHVAGVHHGGPRRDRIVSRGAAICRYSGHYRRPAAQADPGAAPRAWAHLRRAERGGGAQP